jgi:hypothetical protein
MTYEIRCELCENVDRGMDDYSHEVHWISNRCPLYEFSVTYCKINGHFPPVMLIVSLTEEIKKETARQIAENKS